MTARPDPPPRPIAVWMATLVVSLQCSWIVGGGLLRLAQAAIGFGDEWFERLWLPRANSLTFAIVVSLGAGLLMACQYLAVLCRSPFASAVIGVVFSIAGLPFLLGTIVLLLFVATGSGSQSNLVIGFVLTIALLSTGITMLAWGYRLTHWPYSPLPATPPSAEDE